jgi:hypothetical protein
VVEPAGFLEPTARRRIVEQAYGQWLGSLDRNGDLEPTAAPGQRATGAPSTGGSIARIDITTAYELGAD